MARHTDLPLKVLFRTRPQDLLALTGDEGARVLSSRVLELQSVRRTVDCVLELRAGREVYLRHLEFQTRHRPELLKRAFGYNTQLIMQTGVPVATTLVYLYPPAPRGPLVFTLHVRGRELNRWRFDVLRLWDLPARLALSCGPGVMALVPLMRGHDLSLLEAAARRIAVEARPSEHPELLAILRLLAERRYTQSQLARLVTREVLMQSGLWREALAEGKQLGISLGRTVGLEEGRAEGRAQGRAEGRAQGEAEGRERGQAEERLRLSRRLCLSVARRHHRGVIGRLRPVIERCTDVARLEAWIVEPPRMIQEALPSKSVRRASTAARPAPAGRAARRR